MKTIQNKYFAIIIGVAVLLFSYITINYWGVIVSNEYYPSVAQTVSNSTTFTPEEIQKQLNELDSQINQLNQELTNTTNEVNGLESSQKLINQPDGANIFHVATFGNDANDGRSATPIKTIAKAVSLIDTQNIHDAQIMLHDGVYYVDAPVQIKASADSSRTLKIISGQGEKPIIDGSVSVNPQPLASQSGVYLINANYSSGNMPSVWHESRKIRYSSVQSMEVLKNTDYAMYPYSANVIAIHPRGGVLPDSSDLRVSVTDYALNILRSNVSVKDLYFRGFALNSYSAAIFIGSSNMKNEIDNVSISNVNIENSYSGIHSYKSTLIKKISIDNCYIHDVSSGINAHGGDVEITKCKIINDASASNLFAFRQADQYMGGAGINVRDNYGLVGSKYTYNVIKGFQYGIALQATANTTNGAGYAPYEISHNTIVLSSNDITNSGSSFGIQFSRYVGANCDKCGAERAVFMYNIIDGFSIPWNVNKSGASISALATIDKNVLWNSSIDQSTYSKNYAQVASDRGVGTNIVGDPMFVNRSNNDFRIFSNSPAASISAGALENVNGGTTVADFRIDVPTISGKQKTLSTNTYEVIGSDFTMNIIPYDIASSVNTKITIVPGNPDTTSHKFITTENIALPANPGTYTITVVLDNGSGKTSTSHSIIVNKKSSDISFGDNFVRANKYGFLVINKNNQNIDQYISYRKKGSTTWIKGFDDSIYSKAYYDDTKNIGNQPLYVTGLESNTDYEFQITPKQGTVSSVYNVRTLGEPGTIYVSPNGVDDNNRGTSASPLKTLQYALDLALPGDTIKLLSGVYSEPSIIMHGGLSSAHIKISGEDSTKVVLNGKNTYNTVLSIENASYIDIENISIQGVVGSGIYCNKCTNVSISNSRFTNKYISASATSALGNAIYIKDASDIDIHHNLIRNWKFGIQAWTSPKIRINNNTMVAMTEAAVYLNPNCFDSEITYNAINFSINSAMTISVAASDKSRYIIDYNNYAGDISTSRGIPDETTNYRKSYLYNNASYFPSSRELFNYYPSTNSQDLITFASFKNWKSITGWDAHSIFADPLWEDPLSDDFHLKVGSPNILSQGKYIGAFSSGQNIIVESKTDKIYVSSSGSDSSGDGSSGKPFKTIQKAVDNATTGDTIFVKAGKYDGNITIKNSGTNARPIRIEGENYSAEINSGIKYSNWQNASEIGPNVYKVAIAKHPSIVTIDDSKIPFVDDVEMSWTKSTDQDYDPNITGLQIMKSDTSLSIPLGYAITGYSNVKFWDVFYGVAGYMNGYLYVRLKDGSNPNTKNILVHDAGTGISIDSNNIEINGLSIKGFNTGIKINGSNINISGNQIGNSDTRILFAGSGSNNVIRDNKIYMNNYGASTGAWANGSTYDAALKEFIYIFYKYMVGTSSSGDTGISMSQPQNDLTVYNNDIYGGLVALTLGSNSKGYVSSRGSIYNNLIHANSSVGITEMGGIVDYLIYGNTIFDNNSNIRIHMLDSSDYRRVYIYNNKMYQLGSVGNQFFLHWFSGSPKPAKAPENYIYHNSISGGTSSICPDAYAGEYGGVPGAYFVNNIFSSNLFMCNTKLSDISNGIGIFENNWINGKNSNINPQWFGSKNIISNNSLMWNLSSAPNFASISSSAVSAGLDLSKSNTINGKIFPALPGARSGYFSGMNPNMGYVPGLTGDYTKIGEEIIIVESKTDKIYVSNSGSDTSGDGSSAKPYATIQKALDNAVAGDTVFIKAGTYDARRLTIKNSGSAGKPITIEGEKSSSGERLVTFDGGESMSSWVSAPEIGDGVYKIANKVSPANSSVNSLPYTIVIDGKYADPLRTNNYMDMSVEWKKYMNMDINAEVTADNPEHAQSNQLLLGKVKFWDVTKAIFYVTKDYTYLRLADKSNPNNHIVRGAFYVPGYWPYDTFVIKDKNYITIKNINFKTYNNAVSIRGSDSHDIVVVNNKIESLRVGVEVQTGAHDIVISNNDIPLSHFGTVFGAWGILESMTGSQRYELDLRQAIYQWYHHWIFNSSSFMGISLSAYAGSNIDVGNNKITDGFIAIDVTAEKTSLMNNIRIHDNSISRFSSGAIYARGSLVNLQIYNNLTNDTNYAVRNHELDMDAARKVYIYNNWFVNPLHVGNGIFFHYFSGHPIPTNPPEIYIYHNNFIGGRNGLNFDAYVGEYGGAKGMVVLNNIISSGDYDLSGANTPEKDFFGAFDYNWLDNISETYTKRNWFGSNNIKKANGEGSIMTINTPVNSKVSSASRAYQSGIDLSKAQNINGKTIGPLPGMSGCSNSKPDMGVIGSCNGGGVIIIPVNNISAYDGRYTIKKGEVLNGSMSINRAINSGIKFLITTQSFRGIVVVRDNGTFTYTPESNFVGTDYFNFKVNDGVSDSNIATIRITVENNDNTNTGGGGGNTVGGGGNTGGNGTSGGNTTGGGNNNGNNSNSNNNKIVVPKTRDDVKNKVTEVVKTVVPVKTPIAPKNVVYQNENRKTETVVNSTAKINSTLSIGSRGEQVKVLQRVLSKENLLPATLNTGYYGTLTEVAVQRLQKKYNIVTTGSPNTTGFGVVGKKTQDLVNKLNSKIPTPSSTSESLLLPTGGSSSSNTTSSSGSVTSNLKFGSRGEEVKILQQALVKEKLLAPNLTTGYYGTLTQSAVQKLQTKYNVISSGNPQTTGYGSVGPKTKDIINTILKK